MEHDPEQLVSAYSTDQRARVLCPKSYRRNFAGAVQFLRFSLGARMDRKSNPLVAGRVPGEGFPATRV
jgi:hypothetical protein